jgi:hypothetical protein
MVSKAEMGVAAPRGAFSRGRLWQHARSTAYQCPKPVAYDEATLKKISQALRALPPNNVLHQAMEDHENERDDLRSALEPRYQRGYSTRFTPTELSSTSGDPAPDTPPGK